MESGLLIISFHVACLLFFSWNGFVFYCVSLGHNLLVGCSLLVCNLQNYASGDIFYGEATHSSVFD